MRREIFFAHRDLEKILDAYEKGEMLSGEVKAILIKQLNEMLSEHQKRRLSAEKLIDKFIYKN